MKYFFVAGERSGDLHASNLIKELRKQDQESEIEGIGGALSTEAGARLFLPYERLAVMGFAEVLFKLPKILGYLSATNERIRQWKPDVVILIDYGGFNMRLAAKLKGAGIPVYYYITPKIWAWNTSRAYKLKKTVDRLFVILPFEKSFFAKFGMEADYVGNPVLDAFADFHSDPQMPQKNKLPEDKPWLALLPGSRHQEISAMVSMAPGLAQHFSGYHLIIAGVSNVPSEVYAPVLGLKNVHLVYDQAYEVLTRSKLALVTSGTATLETALLKVPQVVVYKTSPISYFLAKMLIKVKYISLVNLIAEGAVVTELIQKEYHLKRVIEELSKIKPESLIRKKQLLDYDALAVKMGKSGASKVTAELMLGYLKSGKKRA